MKNNLANKEKQKAQTKIVFLDDVPDLARSLAKKIKKGDRISFTGEIGAGKTTLIFQILLALGLPKNTPFSSPTFNILNQYQTNQFLINHIDLYRLNSYEELEDIDLLTEIENTEAVTLVEWGNKFSELRSLYTKRVHIEFVEKTNLERMIQLSGFHDE